MERFHNETNQISSETGSLYILNPWDLGRAAPRKCRQVAAKEDLFREAMRYTMNMFHEMPVQDCCIWRDRQTLPHCGVGGSLDATFSWKIPHRHCGDGIRLASGFLGLVHGALKNRVTCNGIGQEFLFIN